MAGAVEEIKARLDIAEVVSERVALKKAGKTLKGLCPFHSEKTPSFIVFPETGTWRCFGCGEGGDVFTFVMRNQNVDFKEALTILAPRAGVELQPAQQVSRGAEDLSDRLVAVNEAAAAYFQAMLAGPAGTRARAYLRDREISEESVEAFRLGFAPDAGAGLAHHLLGQHFDRAVVLQAGVAGENETGGLYDRFRGRLIFPIWDAAGRLIGFGGRALAPDLQPKYLNTPQTPLFDKGGCLYAADRARAEIRRTGQAVIVEGYVDALMAHQHGFRNVIASMGTALTDRQVSQLKRWATELCFALDPDAAGQEATSRGLAVAMESLERAAAPVLTWRGFVQYVYRLKTTIKIIALPEGRDPDEVIRRDPGLWERLVREAAPVQDFFLARVKGRHDLSTAAGKAEAVEEAMAVIGEIPDPIEQAHYVQKLAALVGMEEAILLQKARLGQRRPPRRAEAVPAHAGVAPSRDEGAPLVGYRGVRPVADTEGYCLALLLKDPALLESEPRLDEHHFKNPAYREIFRRLATYSATGKGDLSESDPSLRLRDELEGDLRGNLDQILGLHLRHPQEFVEPLEKAYRSAAIPLLVSNLALRWQQLQAVVADAAASPDPGDFDRLRRAEKELAEEAHRLKSLGATVVPLLRAVHKEVRHGG